MICTIRKYRYRVWSLKGHRRHQNHHGYNRCEIVPVNTHHRHHLNLPIESLLRLFGGVKDSSADTFIWSHLPGDGRRRCVCCFSISTHTTHYSSMSTTHSPLISSSSIFTPYKHTTHLIYRHTSHDTHTEKVTGDDRPYKSIVDLFLSLNTTIFCSLSFFILNKLNATGTEHE